MGKRKKSSRKPQGPKKREPLSTTFNCLFCNHEDSVTCKLDKKGGVGSLSCKICGQQFQSSINYLSHAVDVYSEWIDACDEIANPKPAKSSSSRRGEGGSHQRLSQRESQSQRDSQTYARDEGDKGGGGDGGGRGDDDGLSDLEDEDDDEDMMLRRGSGGGGRRAAHVDDDEDEEDDDF
ncbi:hypothetical protein BDD12DRAFT_843475 [Trichophaea hybrida]|nr:hypothetical protein BDD12DRAFT_843475 [Trichophaea hybrida]